MNKIKPMLITWGLAFVPYLALAWGYSAFTGGGAKAFWRALAVLVAVRMFFAVVETIGNVISWRVYGRRHVVDTMSKYLRLHNFPMREYKHDDMGNYLCRIEGGEGYGPSIKRAAKDFDLVLALAEQQGILLGMHINDAADRALDLYSPKDI